MRISDSPLSPYTEEEADSFLGRDKEIKSIINLSYRSDLLVVYGPSGCGKSSILRAGLSRYFTPSDWFPIYISLANKDYIGNIKKKIDDIRKQGKTSQSESNAIVSADEIIADLKDIQRNFYGPVYLIFDQFEEVFKREESNDNLKSEVNELIQLIGEVLKDENLSTKIILALREEYFGRLYEHEAKIPEIFDTKQPISSLSWNQFEWVFTEMVNQKIKQSQWAKEDENITEEKIKQKFDETEVARKEILKKLKEDDINEQLGVFNIYLSKIFDEEFSKYCILKAESVKDTLATFFNQKIKEIESEELAIKKYIQSTANKPNWEILKQQIYQALVTEDKAKKILNKEEFLARFDTNERELLHVFINKLVEKKLIDANVSHIYIVHDSLGEVLHKKTEELRFRKRLLSGVKDTNEGDKKLSIYDPDTLFTIIPSSGLIEELELLNSTEDKQVVSRFIKEVQHKKEEEERKTKKKRVRMYAVVVTIVAFITFFACFFYLNREANKNYKYILDKLIKVDEVDSVETNDLIEQRDRLLLNDDLEAALNVHISGIISGKIEKYSKPSRDFADIIILNREADNAFNNFEYRKTALKLDSLTTKLETYRKKYVPELSSVKSTDLDRRKNAIETTDLTWKNYVKYHKAIRPDDKIVYEDFWLKKRGTYRNFSMLYVPEWVNDSLPDITNVSIKGWGIEYFPSNLFKLQNLDTLDISNNDIRNTATQESTFTPPLKLKKLNLENNQISDFPYQFGGGESWTSVLENLNLKKNYIKIIDGSKVVGFENLTELDLANNLLEEFPYALGKTSVEILYLSGNDMKELDNGKVTGFKRLAVLDLSHNGLVEFPYGFSSSNMQSNNLKHLNLKENHIAKIDGSRILDGFKNLRYLNLSDNDSLITFPEQLLKLPNIEEIIVDSKLKNIPKNGEEKDGYKYVIKKSNSGGKYTFIQFSRY